MMKTRRSMTLAGGGVWLLLVVASVATGQDREVDLQRLVRDQRTIKARLEKIQSKMHRLAEKLAGEGKAYNAGLLTEALAQIDQLDIDDRIDEVIPDMSSARFSSVERQQEILRNLETVYSVLLDRNDLDKLEKRLDQLKAGIEQIKDLRKAERDIIDETSSLSESEQALVERALEQVADLRRQQQRLRDQTSESADGSNERLEQLKQTLDELAGLQKSELERTDSAIRSVVGTALERIDEAVAAERSALERLPQPAEAVPAEAGPEVEEAVQSDEAAKLSAEARDAFLADQQRAAEALERLGEENLAPGSGRPDASALPAEAQAKLRPAVETAREAIEAAQAAARNEDAQGSKESSREALSALERARQQLANQLEQDPGSVPKGAPQSEREISKGAEQASSELGKMSSAAPDDQSKESLQKASESSQAAAESARQAAQAGGDQKPVEARQAEQQALESLNQARSDLEQPVASAREESDKLAARQNYIEGGMSELEQTLEKLAGMSGNQQASQEQQQQAEQAKQKMGESSESLSNSELQKASEQQQEALDQLAQLEQSLKQSASSAEQKSSQQMAMEEQQYSDLADRQKELEERTRDLMDRLKELKDREQQEALSNAASRMKQASSELSENEGEQAIPREKEAEKYLDQAQKELEEEEEKYQNLRQEELLFKVKEELATLREESAEAYRKTGEIEADRVSKGRLSRSGRSKVKSLAAETRTIRVRNDEMAEKISDDGALVFTFTLHQNSEDLDRIAGMLGSTPYLTDEFTQSIQLEVVERYDELINAMKQELDRRRQAKPESEEPQQGDPGSGKPPLIPQVAELLMVKQMEEAAMRKIDVFIKTHPELSTEGLDEISRSRLVRMGHQHASVTELFQEVVGQTDEAQPHGSETPEKEGNR